MIQEAMVEADKIIQSKSAQLDLRAKYENDPVAFCMDILGDRFTDDVIKVIESVRDNPVTIAKSANGVGKSHSAARIALWFFSVYEDAQVYLTAAPPLDNLRRVLWGELSSAIKKREDIFNYRVRSMSISRGPLSFINGVAIPPSGNSEERVAKFSGKHAPHLLFIVDEGDAVPPEIYRGIEGCMSGGMARLLIMFNPKNQNGPVYERELNHQANVVHLSSFKHPNVVTGKDLIPGAVSRETVVRRINQWSRPLVDGELFSDDCFIIPEFLVGAVAPSLDGTLYSPLPATSRKITDPAFSYMVLGEYPAHGSNRLIEEEWIQAARKRWDEYVAKNGERPPFGDTGPIMGMDVAEQGTDYNAVFLRYGNYVSRCIFWASMDSEENIDRAMRIYLENFAEIAQIDGTGIGSSIAPAMSRRGHDMGIRAISVKVASKPSPVVKSELGEFRMLRDQLWWMVRDWLRTEPAMLPKDDMLIEELRVPTYRIQENGKIVVMSKDDMRDILRRSPDRADALCMTFNPVYRPHFVQISSEVMS